MNAIVLEHGERFASLTVLGKFPRGNGRATHYRVGCVCGWSKDHYSARKLMRGGVTQCSRCRTGLSCKPETGNETRR